MTITLERRALAIDAHAADVLFREAHTAYAFTDEPVSDEQLAAIYDLVRHDSKRKMSVPPSRIDENSSPEPSATNWGWLS